MKQDNDSALSKGCPCTSKKCSLRGNCIECIAIHREKGKMTICMGIVAARLHDKSAEKFSQTLARYRKKLDKM